MFGCSCNVCGAFVPRDHLCAPPGWLLVATVGPDRRHPAGVGSVTDLDEVAHLCSLACLSLWIAARADTYNGVSSPDTTQQQKERGNGETT